MWKYRGFFAKLFFVVFLLSLVLSYVFGIVYFVHDCIGKDCNFCYEINLMRSVFDNLLILLLILSFVKNFENCIFYVRSIFRKKYCLTPVKLKVMLLE